MKENKKVQVHIFKNGPLFCVFKMADSRGGFWQPVTGSVEKGESFREAAIREVFEETGLRSEKSQLVDLKYKFSFKSVKKNFVEKAFALNCADDFSIILSHEHTEFRWLQFDYAMELIKWETNREPLAKLMSLLTTDRF